MMAYLHYPSDETGLRFAASHPNIRRVAWAALLRCPGLEVGL